MPADDEAANRPETPRELAAYVSGGSVNRLVQIGQTRDVTFVVGAEPPAELQSLLDLPLATDGFPPKVSTVSPYRIGVSKSKYSQSDDPYVARRIDSALAEALRLEPFVLVVGFSKAGKSRTLYEAVRATLPGARLVVPKGIHSPGQLLSMRAQLAPPGERIVLWLDDIDRVLAPGGLGLIDLDHYAEGDPPVTVVGTIRSKKRDTARDAPGEVGRTAGQVFDRAHTITLQRKLRQDEQDVASRLYPNEDFLERGIGEQLVAAPELERKYEDGPESDPNGWAVLQAAIDLKRIGLPDAADRDTLRRMFGHYLRTVAPELDATEELFAAGLSWAREPVAGTTIALLSAEEAEDGVVFRPFDYIDAYVDGQRADGAVPIPVWAWQFGIDTAFDEDQIAVGVEALTRGEIAMAREAVGRAVGSDDTETAALANLIMGEVEVVAENFARAEAFLTAASNSGFDYVSGLAQVDLGGLLISAGETERACAVLEAAVRTTQDPHVAAFARVALGASLLNAGQVGRARELLEAGLAADNPDAQGLAQANLGALLSTMGETGRARELLVAALKSGNIQVVPLAQANLGGLLLDSGELAGARELLEAAARSIHPQARVGAQVNLARLYQVEGRDEEARELLESVIGSQNPLTRAQAKTQLAAVLMRSGHVDEARELLRGVVAADLPGYSSRAAGLLGDLLVGENEMEAAAAAYYTAIDSGHPIWKPVAQISLAILMQRVGRADEARELLETVLKSDNPRVVASAQANLGGMLLNSGELERARELLEAALVSKNPQVVALAQANLGGLLVSAGELERGRELLEAALVSKNPDVIALAQVNLGGLLHNSGETERARELLEAALTSNNPRAVPMARVNLGGLLLTVDEPQRARELLEPARRSADPAVRSLALLLLSGLLLDEEPEHAAVAAAMLDEVAAIGHFRYAAQADSIHGDLLQRQQDMDGAIAMYRRAIERGNPMWTPISQIELALLYQDRNEPDQARALFEAAVEAADPGVAASARFGLATLLDELGDEDGAVAALEALVRGGDREFAPLAGGELAMILWSRGQTDRVGDLLRLTATADDPEIAESGCGVLGDFLAYVGDADGALRAYELLLDSKDGQLADLARARMAEAGTRLELSEAVARASRDWLDDEEEPEPEGAG